LAILLIEKLDGNVKNNETTLLRYLCAPKQEDHRRDKVSMKTALIKLDLSAAWARFRLDFGDIPQEQQYRVTPVCQ
jgi:hypothetical protein